MTLIVPWLVFPLVLGALALGAGLLLERAAGHRLPTPLLLPAGIAVITVAAGFTTLSPETAGFTVPVLIALAVLGFGLTRRRVSDWLDRYATLAAVAAFLVSGAPVLASGMATFSGYVKLDDTATFLALTDRTLEHGRDLHGLAPSSYEATLWVNLAHGYPTGSLLPFGAASRILQTDGAWLFQPYLAFLAAMVALGLYALVGRVVADRGWRALAALAGSQSALLYGFSLWGGVKELYAAALVPLLAALALLVRDGMRASLAPAAAAAALLLASSLGAAVWLAPAALAVLLLHGPRGRAVPALAIAFVLALPAVLPAGEFLRVDNRASFRDTSELGNLIQPLSPLQVLGIWPAGDFRTAPHALVLTAALLGLAAALAAFGLAAALVHRATPLLLCTTCSIAGAALVSASGSPWLSAKALAVASPTPTALAFVGAARVGSRSATPLLAALLAVGVATSDALAARSANLAPRDQLAELETIGERFAGRGPALMTEYQPYGVRHFLRELDAEGAGELRRRPVPLIDGRVPGKGESPDLDSIQPRALDVYRLLVLKREPPASRPSARYALAWRGRYYEVWEQQAHAPTVLAHVPLGANATPAAPAPCWRVLALADRARAARGLITIRRAGGAGERAPLFVAPNRARTLCGRTLDWLEVVRP